MRRRELKKRLLVWFRWKVWSWRWHTFKRLVMVGVAILPECEPKREIIRILGSWARETMEKCNNEVTGVELCLDK